MITHDGVSECDNWVSVFLNMIKAALTISIARRNTLDRGLRSHLSYDATVSLCVLVALVDIDMKSLKVYQYPTHTWNIFHYIFVVFHTLTCRNRRKACWRCCLAGFQFTNLWWSWFSSSIKHISLLFSFC